MQQECVSSFGWRSNIALLSMPNSMGYFIYHLIGTRFSFESVWRWNCWLKLWKFWLQSCQAGCLYFEKKIILFNNTILLGILSVFTLFANVLHFCALCSTPRTLVAGTSLKNKMLFIISACGNKIATCLGKYSNTSYFGGTQKRSAIACWYKKKYSLKGRNFLT